MKRLLVVLALVASACGGDSGGGATVPDDSVPLTSTTTSTTAAPTTTTTTLVDVAEAVSITGTALPVFGEAPDQAINLTAPVVIGTGFDGSEVRIEPSGNYTVLMFLAHWCPHCMDEVDTLGPYFEETPLPEGVEVVTISSSVNETRANFPPSEWLTPAAWSQPVLADTALNEVSDAYGLNAFPFWVILDPDGVVLFRTAGSLPLETVEDLFANLAELAQS